MEANSKLIIPFITICVFMVSTKPAYAYLDPGTGSMVLQAVLAAIAGASVTIGLFWRRIKSFFIRLLCREDDGRHDSDGS